MEIAPGFIARHGLVRYAKGGNVAWRKRCGPAGAWPCEVCGYYDTAWPGVYDHCHLHGWVRGVLCVRCNTLRMCLVDTGSPLAAMHPEVEMYAVQLFSHWAKCPDCLAHA